MELTEVNRQNVLLILIVVSLICLCSSFLLFVGAVNVKATIDARISLLETYNSKTIPGLFLFVGLVNMLENGSCVFVSFRLRTVENREKMLKAVLPVLIGGIVLVILELSSTIASLVHIGILDREFGEGIIKAMKEYVKGEELKREIDYVQTTYMCCGEMAYTDWFRYPWIDPSNLVTTHTKYLQNEGLYYSDDTPYSCCDKRSPRPCIHHHIHDNARHHKYDYKSETTLHHEGCRKALVGMYSSILRDISIVSLVAALLKIVVILLLRLIHTSLTMAQQRDDWEATTPAYIYFFKGGDDGGEYEKLGAADASETEDEAAGGGGEGGDTTDGDTPTDGETTEGGTTEGETTDGETTDGETTEGETTTEGDSETDDDEEDEDDEDEEDANANFSPSRDSMRRMMKTKMKNRSRSVEKSRRGGRSIVSYDNLSFQNNSSNYRKKSFNDDANSTRERLFERKVGPGRLVKVDKSKMSSIVTGLKEAFSRPRAKANPRTRTRYSGYAYSSVNNHIPCSETSFINYNDNKINGAESANSSYFDSRFQRKDNWDFLHGGNWKAIDSPCTDILSQKGVCTDGLGNRFVLPEDNGSACSGNISSVTPLQKSGYESFENSEENWPPSFSSTEYKNSGTRIQGNIPSVNTTDSRFANSLSSTDTTNLTVKTTVQNVSELHPLRYNMKTKSTENSSDKWKSLSAEQSGTGADKEVVQFAGRPGDKLVVDNSDASNGPVSKQKSIDIGVGPGNYYSPGHNSTGYSLKPDDNGWGGLSRERGGINTKPDKQQQQKEPFNGNRDFDLRDDEETTAPTRLPPPVICATTLHGTPNQTITRPEPILGTGHRHPSHRTMTNDNKTTWPDISTAMFDPSKMMDFHNKNSHCLSKPMMTPTPTTQQPKNEYNLTSEYDLIPTIQRRGYDSSTNMSVNGSGMTYPPEFSGDEVSPEVANINFPRPLSMDCFIDIDSPITTRQSKAIDDIPFNPVRGSIVSTHQKNQNDSKDGSATPISNKTTSSSTNLDSTVTNSQFDGNIPSQRPSLTVAKYAADENPKQTNVPEMQSSTRSTIDSLSSNGSRHHERKNHARSTRKKNIFLASPISTNSLDLSTSSADSKLFPMTSTPVENYSHLCLSGNLENKDLEKNNTGTDALRLQFKTSQHQTIHGNYYYSTGEPNPHEHLINNDPNKAVDNLIDISDTVHEDSSTHRDNVSRDQALISPFN